MDKAEEKGRDDQKQPTRTWPGPVFPEAVQHENAGYLLERGYSDPHNGAKPDSQEKRAVRDAPEQDNQFWGD